MHLKWKEKSLLGTRGWKLNAEEADDEKILARELLRLELSLQEGIKKFGEKKEIIVCMHYPPTNKELLEKSPFIELLQKYQVTKCLYGHLHAEALVKEVVEGNVRRNNIRTCEFRLFRFYTKGNLKRR